eukprot:3331601-Amphidinium_carterae.1
MCDLSYFRQWVYPFATLNVQFDSVRLGVRGLSLEREVDRGRSISESQKGYLPGACCERARGEPTRSHER